MEQSKKQFLFQRFVFFDGENVLINMFLNDEKFMQDYMFYTPATAVITFPTKFISGKFNENNCHVTIYTVTGIENSLQSNREMYISEKTTKKGSIYDVLADIPEVHRTELKSLIHKILKKSK